MKPILSVVIPAYRSEKTIERAFLSVLEQRNIDVEIIVIEDGVFDNTSATVSKYREIIFMSNPVNLGAPIARNQGLEKSIGRYVMFLDSDDYIEPPLLEELVNALERDNSNLAFGPCKIRNHSRILELTYPKPMTPVMWLCSWLSRESLPPCCVMWRRDALIDIGGWDPMLKKNQDGDLVMRALMQGFRPSVINRGYGVYFQHNSPYRVTSASAEMTDFSQRKIYFKLKSWLDINPSEDVKTALGVFCYKIAKSMYQNKKKNLGNWWLSEARINGLDNHPGTLLHKIVANLVGLKNKELIAVFFSGDQ